MVMEKYLISRDIPKNKCFFVNHFCVLFRYESIIPSEKIHHSVYSFYFGGWGRAYMRVNVSI